MADDADLLISAGFSDAKLAAEVNKVVGKFAAAGKKAQDAFNKTAADGVENSQVVKANAREIERLKRAYDPLYAASKRYEGQLDKLNRAHKVGAINAKQHESALERLNAEFSAGGDDIQKASGATRNYGGSLQQVGFQVGDFATQVGAGTSAAQALGQQLPQLLGAFGTFGALAGAGAAILIPLGAALIRAATDSASLEDRMDDLTKSTDAYVSAAEAAATPVDELRAKFGDLADEIQRVSGIQASFLGVLAKRNLNATAGMMSKEFGGLSTVQEYRGNSQAESDMEKTMRRLRKEFGGNEAAAKSFADALDGLGDAKGPEQVIASVEALQRIMADFALAGGKVSPELESFFSNLASLSSEAANQVESSVSAQELAYSRLVEAYDGDTQKLKALANERGEVDALIANKTGELSDAQIEDLKRVRDEIDKNIAKAKEAAAETDTLLQKQIRAYQSYGESRMQAGAITGGTIDTIKQFEGYSSKPYWDVNAYRAGFGSDTVTLADGSVQKVVQGMTVSLEDANRDLARRVGEFQQGVIAKIGGERFDSFTTEQQAALTSIAYNYGSLPDRIVEAVRSGTAADIGNAIGGLAGDNGGINADRRRKEASAFGGGNAAFSTFEAQQKAEKDAAKETADALKDQVRERERQLNLAKQLSEQLSANLLTEQQSLELDRQRAEQVAAINASELSDGEKAAAIAAVNAELEKQATILKLTEEAKRRGVELDAQMVGSAMTYRQAIEALGETQRQQIVNQEQINAAQERAAEQQQFMADMQDQLKNGLLDAIVAGESFADVLSNIAQQFARAALEAALFNSGPMAGSGGGGGLLGGVISSLFGGFRAGGGSVSSGRAYVVGENGPELMVPGVSGTVLNQSQIQRAIRTTSGATNAGSMNMVIDLRGTTGDRELDAKMRAAGERILMEAKAQTPGWVADNQKRTG